MYGKGRTNYGSPIYVVRGIGHGRWRGGEKVFRVRQLPWQRLKVRKMKKTLEDIYNQQLPDHLKENKRNRIISDVPSRRTPTSDCPDWVIGSDWNAGANGESENEKGED